MKHIFFCFFLLFTSTCFSQFKRFPGAVNEPSRPASDEYNPFSEGTDSLDNEEADSTGQIIYQNTDTINFVKVVREYNLNLEPSAPKFSLDDVHQYQPVMRTEEPSRNLGNNGLPIYQLTYFPTYTNELNMGLNNDHYYLISDEDVKYYQTQRPFTKLFYVTGSERENKFSIEHSQNWGRGLNVGASYESLVSDGFYENQEIDHKNLTAHAWYRSKNKKLNILAHYINNKYNIGANGGIDVSENVYENEDFDSRTNIPVAMPAASKRYFGKNAYLQSSYDLGQSFRVEINDSISDTQLVPRFRFQHTFKYKDHFDNFQSNSLESDFFETTYIADTLSTMDSLETTTFFNEFRLKWLGNKLVDSTLVRQNFLADAYAQLSNTDISMIQNYDDQITDIVLGGSFRSNPLDSAKILYKLAGEYHLVDYRQGDYFLRGEAGFNFDNIAGRLIGFIELSNQEQIYTANHFQQSHYRFDNNFDKLNARTIGGEYYNPIIKAKLKARFVNATNILYYNSDRQPLIDGDATSYLLLNANKLFQFNRFYLNTSVFYQTTSDDTTIRRPELLANGDIFYKGPLFKNNVIGKIGFNARWSSDFEFDDYDPSLDQFYDQNTFTYSNNPEIGFFTNFSLSRARVFLRLDNLTSFLYDQPIIQAHNYPQHDFAFRAGINWVFVN